ncbi:efflux RND transporter periplasmic adaptor subunit [Burkholderia ubonensis]|uniref:efflux RND transporter periplasmic adaptor subunit n=1 Tax=Burkholderia ubonensis TaxID=101571 RepID=UPI0005D9C92B|nr:efflux RND transporter periplasmic adaptor subunit [Burkholderia ubonensis]AJX12755.1 efflux transporter, RND family, MFP subunit [Burkholderia ubonensis MSMB22]KVP50276.1 RND transporter MFP subunit [Burkholderia ubonensis]KVQ11244.1 RND transporter MFP subunit [Burkholderia ubonensis]KVQ90321.1 RND transporter MFP subunit [Burkholderia ubonensis]KVR78766.1 RND transporter MFP subunit [Burkholderia ubonensis]
MEDKHHSSVGIHTDQAGLDLPSRTRVARRARLALVGFAVVLVLLAARSVVANRLNARHLDQLVTQNQQVYVRVVEPSLAANGGHLELPGTLRGYVEAPIYARASGYVRRWNADIGAQVKQGGVLAELDTPELDHELTQAQAQRQQAAAALALARTSYNRAQQLRTRDAVSQQELDDRQGAYNQNLANLAAADANVKRLSELKGFQNIIAPVNGIVTQRNVDVGDLVNAGNSGTGRALFTVVQADKLRLYVQVPQTYAQQVALGQHVSVTQPELAGQTFDGVVTHTAQAIDIVTRTLQIEITLPNADGKLMPGAYVTASLPMASAARLTLPSNTLLFRSEGASVAVVDANGRVRLQPVTIARTLGKTLEIGTGVNPGDRVVLDPSDGLAAGDKVNVEAPAAPATGASAAHVAALASGGRA